MDLGTRSLVRFNELFSICVAGKCIPLGTWEEITEASHYVDFQMKAGAVLPNYHFTAKMKTVSSWV